MRSLIEDYNLCLERRYLEPMRYARIFLANNLPFKWTVNRPNARL